MAPYSARNKVPNIQKLGEELAQRLNLQTRDASAVASGKHTDKVAAAKAASRRRVIDPTTKNEVVIQDVDADFAESIRRPRITVPKAGINPSRASAPNDLPGVDPPFLPQGAGEEYRQTLDDLAPPEANPAKTGDYLHHSTKHRVLYHPLPVADLQKSFSALENTINLTLIAVVVGIVGLNYLFVGGGWRGILASLISGGIVSTGIHLWLRRVQQDANAVNWDAERQRADAASESLVPESVEWMNSLVGIVWKLINPEMFAAMADTLEDVMQASVPPSLIQNVRVSSIGLGDEAFKILSLRALPSSEEGDDEKQHQREIEGEDDPSMKYYNLEASFAYNAIPATGVIGKAKNLHLEVIFYLGVQGLFGVPLPIFVELNGIVGTIRMRFQLTPNPPFLKNLTVTFMGLPKIDASAVPLTSKGFNVLDLPLISGFINSSIAAALDIYVAPKSLIMDMSKLLQGDAVKKETDAVGLIYIKIKRAEGLSAQDKSGSSDPYITVAYAQFGKPVYCTRIIEQELDPTWNEQTCLLVYQDQIIEGEKLSIELWDSDKFSTDDVVGKIKFDLHHLIQDYSNTISERVDELVDENGKPLPGRLYWDIGYFPKAPFKKSMRTHGQDLKVPAQIRDRAEFQDDKGVVVTDDEKSVTTVPPDPSLPSGICSILIHQIENLEMERPSGSFGSYEPWTPAQVTGENTDEEGDDLPSSYCTILQNDELVFRSRTKVSSSTPIFNAQTERFVRDWRNEVYTITCRHAQHREHDPILGSITIKLSEVLQTASQNTAIYALDGGMGYGRIQVSVLFRSVHLRLPKNLLGWNLGSFELLGDDVLLEQAASSKLQHAQVRLHTDVGTSTLRRSWIEPDERGTRWSLQRIRDAPNDLQKRRVLIPVRQRYQTPVRLEFYTRGNRKPVAYALYWLCDLVDNTETVLHLPVYETPMPKQLTQNYSANIESDSVKSTRIGTLKLTVRFKMGMDESHAGYMRTNDQRETYEAWQCNVAEGYRRRIVKRETPATVQALVAEGKVTGEAAELETAGDESSGESIDVDENVVRVPRSAPGYEKEIDDYHETTSSEQWSGQFGSELTAVTSPAPSILSDDRSSLEVQEDLTDSEIDDDEMKRRRQRQDQLWAKADLARKQRGKLNIKRVRNLKFLKDEMRVAGHKVKSKFSLTGREPTVETEV